MFAILKSCKKGIKVCAENFWQSDKFTYFDIHTVCFQLCISTFGYGDTHKVELCDYLILGQFAEQQNMVLDILTERRMENLEQIFLSADKENQKQEKRILELEAQIKSLECEVCWEQTRSS